MSVIQNSNAQNGVPTSFSEFPNVLSSLETSGGNVPLTPNQRADMLRLMANEAHSADPDASGSPNNALITPTPPPMPHNYSGQLANTRQEIDNLVKMQAEQDRSVQHLTSLLQPLSPTGSIPGLGSDGNVPPPPLDLDQIFNNDYFTDLGDPDSKHLGDHTAGHGGTGAQDADGAAANDGDPNDLFDFDHIPAEGDLFDGSHQGQNYNYAFDDTGYHQTPKSGDNQDSGRVVEQLTDSETTSPAAAPQDETPENGSSAKRRKKA
jgi:heat shock transcription factor